MEIIYHKYGIFWEPDQSVGDFIKEWKEKIRSVEPDAVYLDHPVHTTFYLLMANPATETQIIHSLEELCGSMKTLILDFSGWHIFKEDLATGGDTVTLGIKPNKEVLECQLRITQKLLQFSGGPVPYTVDWKGEYLTSVIQWGFPFVGKHWLPHITIASVKKAGKNIIEPAKSSNDWPKQGILGKLALYKINGDNHIHLKTFQLS